jgi:glycine dehydrogenase subunit 1
MDYISNQKPQVEAMLREIGISTLEELFRDVPIQLRLPRPSTDDGMSEYEAQLLMEQLSAKNSFSGRTSYLGAGAYEHQLPALVEAVCSRPEFLTSYTPYQAEASQGMLQAIFEYQSCLCALTGMEAANASLYDGATACAEALLMALRLSEGRTKVVIARSLHPHYRDVVELYLDGHQVQIASVPFLESGALDQQKAMELIDDQTAAVLIQSPNFFGIMEETAGIKTRAKEKGAYLILCANPLAYGLYASAGEQGADIAVGDTQPFGLPLHYGGPYAGYIACRRELVRQLPGRIVGEAADAQGRKGYVLTLQAREQQIRREKATSNICTNQALAALASLVSLLWYGKEGVKALALANFQRASYLRALLAEIPGVVVGDEPIFNEFVVRTPLPFSALSTSFREQGIEPGVDLSRYYPEMAGAWLIAVTETKTRDMLDAYAAILRG